MVIAYGDPAYIARWKRWRWRSKMARYSSNDSRALILYNAASRNRPIVATTTGIFMHRESLLNLLRAYRPHDADEAIMHRNLVEFVSREMGCFERATLEGHITGSAWIVDHECNYALLTHHRKLDRWLQLGGHADGETDVQQVALREAREESGLHDIHPQSAHIFDIDVHAIPARGAEPRHLHYDVRFLLAADRHAPLVISSESKDLAWVALADISRLSTDRSIARMTEKSRRLNS